MMAKSGEAFVSGADAEPTARTYPAIPETVLHAGGPLPVAHCSCFFLRSASKSLHPHCCMRDKSTCPRTVPPCRLHPKNEGVEVDKPHERVVFSELGLQPLDCVNDYRSTEAFTPVGRLLRGCAPCLLSCHGLPSLGLISTQISLKFSTDDCGFSFVKACGHTVDDTVQCLSNPIGKYCVASPACQAHSGDIATGGRQTTTCANVKRGVSCDVPLSASSSCMSSQVLCGASGPDTLGRLRWVGLNGASRLSMRAKQCYTACDR